MPLYEYECATDGRFEVIRRFSDPPLSSCPTCGSPVEKQASAPAIQFKGSGWYITDYARKSPGDVKGGDKGEASSEKSVSEKPAAEKSSSEKPASKDSTPTASSAPTGTKSTSSGGSDSK